MHADYLSPVLTKKRTKVLAWIAAQVKQTPCDLLVFSGLSGALIAPELSAMTGKPYAIVRKPDNSHSPESVEFSSKRAKHTRYIIIDDLIYTGKTVDRMMDRISDYSPQLECVKMLMYYRHYHQPSEYEGIPVAHRVKF